MLTIFTAYNSTRLKMSKILPCALPGFIRPHTSTKKMSLWKSSIKSFSDFIAIQSVPGWARAASVSSIAANILAARKLAPYEGGTRVPTTVSAIADAVRWAEMILAYI
jgi:hypothetical protein